MTGNCSLLLTSLLGLINSGQSGFGPWFQTQVGDDRELEGVEGYTVE